MIGPHLQLFKCLNDHKVEYLLIGGTAAIAYGIPRTTKDIDLFVAKDEANAQRCLNALKALGFGTTELTTAKKLVATEVTIFKDLLRVDVLTQVKGMTFEEASQNRVFFDVDGILIPVLRLEDLIITKKAAGRPGDLEDVKILESILDKQSS
jgi:predicted nucleotidyltransferase